MHLKQILPIAAFLPLMLLSSAEAHSGRTNSSGCHNNRKTRSYHCHGGGSSSGGSRSNSSPGSRSYGNGSSSGSSRYRNNGSSRYRPTRSTDQRPNWTIETSPTSQPNTPKPWNVFETVEVLSIGDGDTLRIQRNNEAITVRIACIDAPEMRQAPYGKAASDRLKELIGTGSGVNVRPITKDRYGRTIGEIYKSDKNIGLQLVVEGHAVAYRQYLDQCNSDLYLRAEHYPKRMGIGFWEKDNPVMPWDFRKQAKDTSEDSTESLQVSTTTSSTTSQSCDSNYKGACIQVYSQGDVDCGEIKDRNFRSVGSDPHRLDRDKDGIACESR